MKITAHIHAHWNKYSKEFQYSILSAEDMSEYGYIHILSTDIEFESLNDRELRGRAVLALQAQKRKIYVDAEAAASEVNAQIDQLTALEHKPEEETAAGDAL